mgnify:CR=1 FL=1
MSEYKIHHDTMPSGDRGDQFYKQLAKVVAISFFKSTETQREAGFLLNFIKNMLPGLAIIDQSFDQNKFLTWMEEELEMLETPWLRNVSDKKE